VFVTGDTVLPRGQGTGCGDGIAGMQPAAANPQTSGNKPQGLKPNALVWRRAFGTTD